MDTRGPPAGFVPTGGELTTSTTSDLNNCDVRALPYLGLYTIDCGYTSLEVLRAAVGLGPDADKPTCLTALKHQCLKFAEEQRDLNHGFVSTSSTAHSVSIGFNRSVSPVFGARLKDFLLAKGLNPTIT